MKLTFEDILIFITCVLIAWMMVGCKVQDCIPETIVRDSIRMEYKLDSIYLYERDSIYIHAKADTVWVEKWKTRYKDVLKIERDTIYQENKVVEVNEVKYIPDWVKWLAWIGGGSIALLLIRVALWIYRKFVLKL